MTYLALYDGYYGEGDTLKEAFDELRKDYRDDLDVDDVYFFKGEPVKVKMELQEVKSIKKVIVEDDKLDLGLDTGHNTFAQHIRENTKKW